MYEYSVKSYNGYLPYDLPEICSAVVARVGGARDSRDESAIIIIVENRSGKIAR